MLHAAKLGPQGASTLEIRLGAADAGLPLGCCGGADRQTGYSGEVGGCSGELLEVGRAQVAATGLRDHCGQRQ